jgi:hypothetical protein
MRVRSVSKGLLLLVDAIDLALTVTRRKSPTAILDGRGRPWWWKPNLAGLARMVEAAGFRLVATPDRCFIPAGTAQGRTKPSLASVRSRVGRETLMRERLGDPHGVLLAEAAN